MAATKFFKNYTQDACEKALKKGYSVGVSGNVRPDTDKITIPHKVLEARDGDKIIGYSIIKIYLDQSDNWDEHFDFIKKNPNQEIAGFPFSIEWPRMYLGKKYQIITFRGQILEARVDDSREFASEGLEWNTREGNKGRQVIVAWKEIWQRACT